MPQRPSQSGVELGFSISGIFQPTSPQCTWSTDCFLQCHYKVLMFQPHYFRKLTDNQTLMINYEAIVTHCAFAQVLHLEETHAKKHTRISVWEQNSRRNEHYQSLRDSVLDRRLHSKLFSVFYEAHKHTHTDFVQCRHLSAFSAN